MKSKTYPIKIGIIDVTGESKLSIVLKYLILQQNVLQSSFEFAFFPVPQETELFNILQTQKVLDRIQIEGQLSEFAKSSNWEIDQVVIVSKVKFSDGFYLVGNDWNLIALGYWKDFMAPPSFVEFILSLIMASAVGFVLGDKLADHYETKGCLFDLTPDLNDARYWVLTGFICKSCKEKIASLDSENLLKDTTSLLGREWLGTTNQPSEIANTVKKLGYNIFRTKGIKRSPREVLSSIMEDQFVKFVFGLVLTLLSAYLLFKLGLCKCK
jgi:hypothetical protein